MAFNENYFSTNTYKDVSFARYSQYWWSNRFYAILVRRYSPRGARLLEIGSGLGHLVGQLEGDYRTAALDVNHWALVQSKTVAPHTSKQVASAEDLPYPSGFFGIVIIKHVVEHLVRPARAISELGRVIAPDGALILATPNLASLSRPWKGDKWIGYQDKTHISLKAPSEWLALLNHNGFKVKRVFSDGFWDAPYLPIIPKSLQKLLFGSLGGFQAVSGVAFLPLRWGESIMVVAVKQ